MTNDDTADLAWRNLITQWHLDRGVPDCGCDDDTADGDFCQESKTWADERFADLPVPEIEGPPDFWDHDIWVAAWGYNAPMVISLKELSGIPPAPAGTSWLLTRMLVRGVKAIELMLVRMGRDSLVTVARGRTVAEPTTIAAKARRMLQQIPD